MIQEVGTDLPDVQLLYKNVRNEEYGRIAENDVRATAWIPRLAFGTAVGICIRLAALYTIPMTWFIGNRIRR